MRPFSSNANRSILLIIFSTLSILGLAGWAVLNAFQALGNSLLAGVSPAGLGEVLATLLGALLCIVFSAPLLLDSIRQVRGGEIPAVSLAPIKGVALLVAGISWGTLLLAASAGTLAGPWGTLLTAPSVTLGIVLATLTLGWIAAGGLLRASRRRVWGTLALSITGSSVMAIVLQYIPLILLLVGVGVTAASRPELLAAIEQLRTQAETMQTVDELMTLLVPYLARPGVIAAIFVFAAGIAPLTEELVKPLAVWLLGRRLHSPAEGFALGAISGAGFALIEGLLSASMMVDTPYVGLPARAASSLMHVTLSAIMGWGIASAFLEKRWGRLLGAYALSVTLHGLWNGAVVLAIYGALRMTLSGMAYDPGSAAAILAGLGLILVVFITVAVGLPLLNHRLRTAQSDIIAPLASQPDKDPHGLDSQSS